MNEPCPKCGEYHNQCFELKKLTDEEIMAKADETCLTAWIAINPIMNVENQKEIANKKIVEFARAILRKAQE
jgi:hypothetical protein